MKKERLHTMDPNISNLPDPIVHHIMSFLPTLDVTRLSILSKRFFSLWGSYPVIEFDQKRFAGKQHGTSSDHFLDHVLNSVLLRKTDTVLSEFRVKANLEEISADRRFDLAILMVLANGVRCMELNLGLADYVLPTEFASKTINVLSLKGLQLDLCNLIQVCPLLTTVSLTSCAILHDVKFSSKTLMEIELCSCCVKFVKINAPNLHSFVFASNEHHPNPCKIDVLECRNIKYLSLNNVVNADDWIEKHIRTLSELKTFILNGCQDIRHIRVWNDKLETIDFARCGVLTSIELKARSLISFSYAYKVNTFFQGMANITFLESEHIKDVSIKGAGLVTDQWLEGQLVRMSRLESLRLEACNSLRKIKVFHEKLQILEIYSCRGLEEAYIDTPELVSFMYDGKIIEFGKMVTRSSCTATLSMEPWTSYDNESFCRWRKLLSFFGHCKALKLVCNSPQEVMMPELHRERLVSPLYGLQHLEIKIKSLDKIDGDLVDALLWLSPLLKTLHVSSDSHSPLQIIIKFVYSHHLIEGEEDRNMSCCGTKPIKCWKHHLKRLEIQGSDVSLKNGSNDLQNYFLTNAKISICFVSA